MKHLKFLSLILLIFFAGNFLHAQVYHYGSAASGTYNVNSGDILYTDDVRGEVLQVFPGPGPTASVTLNATYYYTAFSNGDQALLIQMLGTGIGIHQNVTISGVSGTTMTVTPVDPGANVLSYTATGSGNSLQLVKIHEYYDFVMNGGAVLCNRWDGHTGGVLCMLIAHDLTVNDGVFSVSGAGLSCLDGASVTFAPGGAGGSGSSTPGASASAPSGYTLAPNCSTIVAFVTTGGTGGPATSGSAGITNTGTPALYGGPTFKTILVGGDPGYWQSGYGSGDGAQGGGKGGTGANSGCPNTGAAGTNGGNGGPGGDAGLGGNGGGCMVIKVGNNVTVYPLGYVFLAQGQNGQSGSVGGAGGVGGPGGAGGAGCCSPYHMQGDDGADGDFGNGGNGGDAGDGGDAGTVWLGVGGSYTYSATNEYENFNLRAGAGGKAGLGGYGGYNKTVITMDIQDCGNTCGGGGGGGGCTETCDPDNAMRILACQATGASPSGTTIVFSDGMPQPIAVYDTSTGKLESYYNYHGTPSFCWDKYIAYFYDLADASAMFHRIAYKVQVIGSDYTGIFVDLNPTYTTYSGSCGSSSISYPVDIYFTDGNGNNLINYHHQSATATPYIENLWSTPTYCYVDACTKAGTQPNGSSPTRGTAGRAGQAGNPGVFSNSPKLNATHHGLLDAGSAWKRATNGISKTADMNPLGAKVYPNPAAKDAWIELETEKSRNAVVKIFDMSGKLLMEQKEQLNAGKNKFHVNTGILNTGAYILQLETPDGLSRFSLMIE